MRDLPDASFDLVVCDGPYAVTTHAWDNVPDIQHFNLELLKSFSRLLKPGGAAYLFGKQGCVDFIDYRPFLTLQSKIVCISQAGWRRQIEQHHARNPGEHRAEH